MGIFGVRPVALLTVALPNLRADELLDPIFLGALFDLTPAEVRIATALVQGRDLKDVAKAQRISIETIRSQLKSIYMKTDTHRRAQLVELLLRVTSLQLRITRTPWSTRLRPARAAKMGVRPTPSACPRRDTLSWTFVRACMTNSLSQAVTRATRAHILASIDPGDCILSLWPAPFPSQCVDNVPPSPAGGRFCITAWSIYGHPARQLLRVDAATPA